MSALETRPIPHNLEAEQHVIGACLVDGRETIARCLDAGISHHSFFDPHNAAIFSGIEEVYAICPPVTLEVLAERLASKNIFEQVGGFPYLLQVTKIIPTTAHAGYFIERVRTLERQRATIHAADLLRARAFDPALGEDGLSAAQHDAAQAFQDTGAGSNPLGPMVTGAALRNAPPPFPPEVVVGILRQQGTMMISGPSKARKTYCFLDLAISVATGLPWLGFETRRAPVIYLNLELMECDFAHRVEAICRAKGIAAPEPSELFVCNLYGKKVTVPMLETFLPRMIEQRGAGMAIVDPWYVLSARSKAKENANEEQANILLDLQGIVCGAGAALQVGHHFAKGDSSAKHSLDRGAGAGAMSRWGYAIATLTPHKETDAAALEFHLRGFARSRPRSSGGHTPFGPEMTRSTRAI